MKKKDVKNLQAGIYHIYWHSGGVSLASVGVLLNGDKWLAPVNWVAPTTDTKVWRSVKKVYLLLSAK